MTAMATTMRSKRKASALSSGRPDGQHGRAVSRLISRARGLAAEAESIAARRRDGGLADEWAARDVRRRALLLKEEVQSLLDELETARGDVDRQMKSRASQAVAISAYASCRRITQQYARDLRQKK